MSNMTRVEFLATVQRMPDGPAKRGALDQYQRLYGGSRDQSVNGLQSPAEKALTQEPNNSILDSSKSKLIMPRHVTGVMNKTEAAYASRLEVLKANREVLWWRFEPVKFRLSSGESGRSLWFLVDFMVQAAHDGLCFDEVKGGYITPDGLQKWRFAAEQYPELRFRLWQKKKSTFLMVRSSSGSPTQPGSPSAV